jgi:hypothetical protein
VDNDDDRFVRTPQEWLVPHLPSRTGDGGLKWRPKIHMPVAVPSGAGWQASTILLAYSCKALQRNADN